ncbi:MAG: glycosyltransferase family 9 protein [Nitrospinae bacterium]|nr:glycosyltransferase family 9 protein [Nitrospinota bacterium]
MTEVKNILIISLTRMGDLIQTTPLIRGLREKYPGAKVSLMVSSDFAGAVSLIPGIDNSIIFNLRQFKDSDNWEDKSWVKVYRYLESELNQIRDDSYDLLVNLSHSRLSALMVHYLKVKNIIGFHCNSSGDRMTGHPWMQYFGTEPFNRSFNEFNLVEIFSRSGGIDLAGKEIQVLEQKEDFQEKEKGLENLKNTGDQLVIGFQIGSSLENRRWSTPSFAKLADLLTQQLNAQILLFGVESESPSAKELIGLVEEKSRITDLTGKTDLKQLAELLKGCDYLVTNDTGTMHLAAALKTKTIGLFFAHAHPFETAPFSSGHLVFQARISCAPCSYGVHCNNIVCIEKVLPEHILACVRNHIEYKSWKLPADLENAEELNVYETVNSAQGIVNLKPLIRHGLELNDVFRMAYAVLWREALDVKITTDTELIKERLDDYGPVIPENFEEVLGEKIQCLKKIEQYGNEGVMLCEDIVKNASGKNISPSILVKFGEDIDKLDEEIELIGMAHPELKPITDLFGKRKENQIGNDIARLAIESRKGYRLLNNESKRMIEILLEHEKQISKHLSYSTHSSIRVAVPGR